MIRRKRHVVIHIRCFKNAECRVIYLYRNCRSTTSISSLVAITLTDIQPQAFSVKVYLVITLLQHTRHILCILKLSQIDVAARFLDCVTDQFCTARFSLSADYRGLLFLTSLVDYECGALRFLLRDLFRFDCCCEFWRKGEVLT